MIFAIATDERSLQIFSDMAAATAYAEGIDVEDGSWLFFSSDGSPLTAEFETPNMRSGLSVVSGDYSLKPDATKKDLLSQLHEVANFEPAPGFASLEEVRRYLQRFK